MKIIEQARTILLESKLPKNLWSEAVNITKTKLATLEDLWVCSSQLDSRSQEKEVWSKILIMLVGGLWDSHQSL
jgi:hypothetical protein